MTANVEGVLSDIQSLLLSGSSDDSSKSSLTVKDHYYDVENVKASESAWVLFTQERNTKQKRVLKVLRKYEDIRFSLKERAKRQQCQLEAIRRNREFTRGVYSGLARIHKIDVHQKRINLGHIIKRPTQEDFNPEGEYALLMRKLPEDRSLDNLLGEKSETDLYGDLQLVTEFVAKMHRNVPAALDSLDEGIFWGSPQQLQRKLEDNFQFAESALLKWEGGTGDPFGALRKAMRGVFTNSNYLHYFEQRRDEGQIKSCHGDIKSTNIWLMLYDDHARQRQRLTIKLLDAIDFNHWFSNVDVLSDFAMLVVDVQSRTQSTELARFMIQKYLSFSDEYLKFDDRQKEVEKSVLAYYLIEKAIVSATISFLHDDSPQLGQEFFKTAEMWLNDLNRFISP